MFVNTLNLYINVTFVLYTNYYKSFINVNTFDIVLYSFLFFYCNDCLCVFVCVCVCVCVYMYIIYMSHF